MAEGMRERAVKALAEVPRPCSEIDGLLRLLLVAFIEGYDAGSADALSAEGDER